MKKRVKIELIVASQADGNSIATAINTFLGGKSIFSIETSPVCRLDAEDNKWKVSASIRFNIPTDADNWLTWVQDKWTTGPLKNLILTGSRVNIHSCTHDDPTIISCSSPTAAYIEIVK